MTIEDVKTEVERIRQIAGQPESAHKAEDDLHAAVLEAIAKGAKNPAELAAEALETARIRFSRWYA
jgi:hypothetical protein